MDQENITRWLLITALFTSAYFIAITWRQDYYQSPAIEARDNIATSSTRNGESAQSTSLLHSIDQNSESTPKESKNSILSEDSPLLKDKQNQAIPVNNTDFSTNQRCSKQEGLIAVETDVFYLLINPIGGDIVCTSLPLYPVTLEDDTPLQLFQKTASRTYIAQSGLLSSGKLDANKSNGRLNYKSLKNEYQMSSTSNTLLVEMVALRDGFSIKKSFIFNRNDYLVKVEHEVKNTSNERQELAQFAQIKRGEYWPEYIETNFFSPSPYLGGALTTPESRYEKLYFSDLEDGSVQQYKHIKNGWIAFLQHYFLSAWIPNSSEDFTYFAKKVSDGLFVFGYKSTYLPIQSKETVTLSSDLYIGPKKQQVLSDIAENLELTIDYGFLWWMALPLFWVLAWLNEFLNNWGLSIIVLTVLIKMAMYPLSAMSFKSMANMKKLMPKVKQLQEQHADDRQKLSTEMMNLYRKENVNPLGGCLPMLLQMPVFIALYWVLLESVELRQAPFLGWIHDLSVLDPYFILPILMGLTMFLQQQLNPQVLDPVQANVMKFMPVMFTLLFLFFPAGLVLYWLVNNVLSILQQWWVNKRIGL